MDLNVIYILWLRQVKRYFRSTPRIVGALGQPLLFLLALGFGFGPIYAKAGGGNYIQFLAPGIISMSILFTSMFTGIEVIWDRQFGFLKETLVAPISRFEVMIGRTLGGATIATVQGCIVFTLSFLVGFRPADWAVVPFAIIYMFLTAVLFTAFGTALASLLDDMQGFHLIMNFLIMPIFFLSGALFPLQGVSGVMGQVANLDPLSYGVDAIRGTLINLTHFGLGFDLIILTGLAAFFLALGSWLFSRIQI